MDLRATIGTNLLLNLQELQKWYRSNALCRLSLQFYFCALGYVRENNSVEISLCNLYFFYDDKK